MKIEIRGQTYILNPNFDLNVDIRIRSRGESLRTYTLTSGRTEKETRLASMFAEVKKNSENPKTFRRYLGENFELLTELGVLISPQNRSRPVDPRQPVSPADLDFVSVPARLEFERYKDDLVPNSLNVFFQNSDSRPHSKHPGLPLDTQFPVNSNLVWVRDPATGIWSFYPLGTDLFHRAKNATSGARKFSNLSLADRELLFQSQIFTLTSHQRRAQQNWLDLKRSAASTRKAGYRMFRKVLPPLTIARLRKYAASLKDSGYFSLDERQVRDGLRLYCSKDPVCEFFNRQGGTLIRHATGEAVFPSWSLFSSYLGGAELKRHVDRDQCAWNVSIPIGDATYGADYKSWPLFIEPKGHKPKEFSLEAGDAVIYRGSDLYHWRPPLAQDRLDTIMLWFYVPVDFMGEIRL